MRMAQKQARGSARNKARGKARNRNERKVRRSSGAASSSSGTRRPRRTKRLRELPSVRRARRRLTAMLGVVGILAAVAVAFSWPSIVELAQRPATAEAAVDEPSDAEALASDTGSASAPASASAPKPRTYAPRDPSKDSPDVREISLSLPLIAHAGGAYREADGHTAYTNSLETLEQNYELGLRAFEFDFNLTSDGDLACLHNWEGGEMSAEEWRAHALSTTSGTTLTPMVVGDLLDTMLGLPDMVLIADTKAQTYSDTDKIRAIYQRFVDAAKERDPALLSRIVPYVYSPETYEIAMDVYDWPCLIYASYGNADSSEDNMTFVAAHDNLRGVCCNTGDTRFGSEQIATLRDMDVRLYTYTVNDADTANAEFARGVSAVITDSLVPSDVPEHWMGA